MYARTAGTATRAAVTNPITLRSKPERQQLDCLRTDQNVPNETFGGTNPVAAGMARRQLRRSDQLTSG